MNIYKTFILLSFATLLTGVNGGFVEIFVFKKIAEFSLSSFYFTLVYSLFVIASLLGITVGEKLLNSPSMKSILIGLHLLAILTIVIIFNQTETHHIKLILMSEAITAFVSSLSFPMLQKVIKQSFSSEKLPVASKIDAYIFGANIFIGLGIGSILVSFMSLGQYLSLIITLYLLVVLLLFIINYKDIINKSVNYTDRIQLLEIFNSGNKEQKLTFILILTICIICVPATSLLPSTYSNIEHFSLFKSIRLDPVLILIFSRSIGQFLGPLLIPNSFFKVVARHSFMIYLTLGLFIICYLIIFNSHNYMIIPLVILAHIFSNMASALSYYLTLDVFDTSEIAFYSSYQTKLSQIIVLIASLLSGVISSYIGLSKTILFFGILGFVFYSSIKILFGLTDKKKEYKQ